MVLSSAHRHTHAHTHTHTHTHCHILLTLVHVSFSRSPTMAGGLFGIHREYFYEIGAYDMGMDGYGSSQSHKQQVDQWGNPQWLPCLCPSISLSLSVSFTPTHRHTEHIHPHVLSSGPVPLFLAPAPSPSLDTAGGVERTLRCRFESGSAAGHCTSFHAPGLDTFSGIGTHTRYQTGCVAQQHWLFLVCNVYCV